MKSLFQVGEYEEVLLRLDRLREATPPLWGSMNAAQMLCHCTFPLAVALRKKKMARPNPVMRLLFKAFKSAMYNDRPWKQGMKTPEDFKVNSQKIFGEEKERLQGLLEEFHAERHRDHWEPHPVFGEFSREQWGQMQFKHLDHHLRQFGL